MFYYYIELSSGTFFFILYLANKSGRIFSYEYGSEDNILDGITSNDMNSYRMAQTEAQAYLFWLKSFARAYLKDSSKEQ